MPVNRRDNEAGFTMIMTTIGLSLMATLVLVAVTAVGSDVHLTGHDSDRKRAYEAAKAGIDDYAYNLHVDNGYWAKCTNVAEPNAVNQVGKTEKKRSVPGTTTSVQYAIELIPATGHEKCDPTNITTATVSMLESLGAMKGTFRIRSTGYAGDAEVSVTATFKPASFLDYVYFTQLETSDPVTYGTQTIIEGAEKQCSKTLYEKRNDSVIPGTKSTYCRVISFVSGDELNGPVHTNDAFVICGYPVFGRDAADSIEVSSPPVGWYETEDVPHSGSGCNGKPTFDGTYRTNAAVLVPPTTNGQLAEIAEPSFRYKGQVHICLNGTSMKVATGGTPGDTCDTGNVYSGAFPTNGVVYVESGVCSGAYTPFDVTYPETSECGNVFVHGTYSEPLTIAAGNDIVIDKSLESSGEEGILGLIANNFIRIYHPFETVYDKYGNASCENAAGSVENIKIEAALLAINHSFIVDNYDCGDQLGTLYVHGAISQKFRGAVGTTGGTGYLKSYNYDDRLHTITPPSFIEPVQSDWVIGRETVG